MIIFTMFCFLNLMKQQQSLNPFRVRYVDHLTLSETQKNIEYVENYLLPKLFGHTSFRSGQREIISNILNGQSSLAILPTGAGKSLLYMLPAQVFEGMTIVVSPLLSLMRDQVEILREQGIQAARLDSTLTIEGVQETMNTIRMGHTKILYVSPERFNNENFKSFIASVKVSMFVVDEAHCISGWLIIYNISKVLLNKIHNFFYYYHYHSRLGTCFQTRLFKTC
jgi:superfamily II DNA helicase RecQ